MGGITSLWQVTCSPSHEVVDLISTSESERITESEKSLPPLSVLLGSSPAAQELVRNLGIIAATDLSVLLQGEAGTGKRLVARWLHNLSPYSRGRFITVHASGGQDWLQALSIAGQLEDARIATLFVENVEALGPGTQASLARYLQDGSLSESGTGSPPAGVRIVSATQKELKTEAARGTLRPEFFHCISAFTLRVPPLRSRLDEMPQLVSHFTEVHGKQLGASPRPLSANALQALQEYHWPGNLRELEEMLIGYVLSGSEELLLEKISGLQRSSGPAGQPGNRSSRWETVSAAAAGDDRLDENTILRALRENGWNRRLTAQKLQISYRSLLYKLKKMDSASGRG